AVSVVLADQADDQDKTYTTADKTEQAPEAPWAKVLPQIRKLREFQAGDDVVIVHTNNGLSSNVGLRGVARTDQRPDGSFGLTLIAGSASASYLKPIVINHRIDNAAAANKKAKASKLQDTVNGGGTDDNADAMTMRSYIAADIDG